MQYVMQTRIFLPLQQNKICVFARIGSSRYWALWSTLWIGELHLSVETTKCALIWFVLLCSEVAIGSVSHSMMLGSDLCFSWVGCFESLVGEKFCWSFLPSCTDLTSLQCAVRILATISASHTTRLSTKRLLLRSLSIRLVTRSELDISPSLAIHDFDLMPGCKISCVYSRSLACSIGLRTSFTLVCASTGSGLLLYPTLVQFCMRSIFLCYAVRNDHYISLVNINAIIRDRICIDSLRNLASSVVTVLDFWCVNHWYFWMEPFNDIPCMALRWDGNIDVSPTITKYFGAWQVSAYFLVRHLDRTWTVFVNRGERHVYWLKACLLQKALNMAMGTSYKVWSSIRCTFPLLFLASFVIQFLSDVRNNMYKVKRRTCTKSKCETCRK